jgi:integrase/recombinase XerD
MEPYRSYLQFKKSEDTRYGIISDFSQFKKRTGVWLHEATEKDLTDYFLRMKSEVSQRTLSRYKGLMSAFFKWLEAMHLRKDNPGIVLRLIQIEPAQGKPKALNEQQIQALMEVLLWEPLKEFQISLFMVLGMDTGLRLSELMRLKWSDVDLQKGTIKALRKGNKQWDGRIPTRSLKLLETYKERIVNIPTEWVFFNINNPEKYMHKSSLAHWCMILKKRLGWGKEIKFTPHVLRHILCTRLANAGVRDEIAIKITGHAGVEVYKKNYVKVEAEQIEEESKRVLG